MSPPLSPLLVCLRCFPPSQEEYEDADIVFSSHADTLQIAQCYIAGADERLFSQVRTGGGKIRVTDGSEGGGGGRSRSLACTDCF